MTKKFNYNFINKTIEGSKRSIERANKGLSPEYQELTQMLAEQPGFKVVVKVINSNENKKTYKHLGLDRMKEYIDLQDNSAEKLVEFEAVKKVAKAKGAIYPICKKWFFMTYPEYKETAVKLNQGDDVNEKTKEIEAMVDLLMEDMDDMENQEVA